ncbi:MAG: hypothetical protein NTX13_22610 [Acidobacteria bacterium]|nr:hypothetical protein [Acidobacteriota bacterium]
MSDLRNSNLMQVPDLGSAIQDLSQFETSSALLQLEAALGALRVLAVELERGKRMDPMEQRATERALLEFREQLRVANLLTRQGLAYCRNWSDALMPPADSYGSQGQERPRDLDFHAVRLEG